jgi:hypothetical protein
VALVPHVTARQKRAPARGARLFIRCRGKEICSGWRITLLSLMPTAVAKSLRQTAGFIRGSGAMSEPRVQALWPMVFGNSLGRRNVGNEGRRRALYTHRGKTKNPWCGKSVNQGIHLFYSREDWLPVLLDSRTNGSGPRIYVSVPFSSYAYFAEREFLEAEYVINQKSAKAIAKEYGCSHSTILKYLKEFGIPVRASSPRYKQGQVSFGMEIVDGELRMQETEEAIIAKIQLLREQGFSYHRIASVLNTLGVQTKQKTSLWHATTVLKILRGRIRRGQA